MDSQTKQLLQHLRDHRCIQPMTALRQLGIYRLAARIKDLRDEGHEIITDRVGQKRIAEYTLIKEKTPSVN
jgi:hypothetical protein